jgi:hypothetical protein
VGGTAGRVAERCGFGRRTPSEIDGWVSRMKRGAVATIVVGWALEIVSDLGMASIEAEDCDGVGIGWHGSNVCSACRLLPPSEFGRVLQKALEEDVLALMARGHL